ncbi:MAG: HTTM domain-containing protein [Bacteroidota bacterium]
MYKSKIISELFRPVSAIYLGVFRLIFGLVMMFQFQSHFIRVQDYDQEGVTRFLYPGLDFIPVANADTFQILLWLGIIGAFCLCAGLLFRWSTTLVFIIFSYIQLQDALHYNNHYYFFSLVCLLLIFTQADQRCSIKSYLNKNRANQRVLFMDYFILQVMVFIVYFYGGLAKLNTDWLSGAVTKFMWSDIEESTALAIAWSGMLFDLLIGILLFIKKTRWPAIILAILFHLTNGLLFFGDIHLFPWAMIAATLLFVDPDWWDRFKFQKGKGKKSVRKNSKTNSNSKSKGKKSLDSGSAPIKTPGRWVVITLSVFFVFQFIFPLRHYLIPGNVDWTGQGHYMAWRMKSYHKTVSLNFSTYDQSGRLVKDYQNLGLSQEAVNRIGAFPHLVLQLAKEVNRQLTDGDSSPPRLQVDYLVGFNGRPRQAALDNEANIGTIAFSPFGENGWIRPLE